ncbi:MAG: hypothetical protein MK085_06845 [Phycisphaerales bacterium]|nr:hypothetical protein [Phycisphaerales bacterium]
MRKRRNHTAHERDGFTLLELLVVMGLLILLAVLTGIGVNRLSNQARVSTGANQVLAALGNARAYAIQNNVSTMLAFMVKVDPSRLAEPERVELILAEYSEVAQVGGYTYEIFLPVAGMKATELPRGIKVAGSIAGSLDFDGVNSQLASSGLTADTIWVTQPGGTWRMQGNPSVPHTDEIGRQIAVIFAPDGTMSTRNIMNGGGSGERVWPFIDFNRNRSMNRYNVVSGGNPWYLSYTGYNDVGDELDVFPCQFLAVYDDEEARKSIGDDDWTGTSGDLQRIVDITRWVDEYGTPIHFNRYTGVAEVDRQ